jgi:CO/xanthine dehydrogenase FAD-binding subunit
MAHQRSPPSAAEAARWRPGGGPGDCRGDVLGDFRDKALHRRLTVAMPGPVALPQSLDEAVEALRGDPGAMVLAGGTDLMVEVNAGRRRPATVVSLGRVPELKGWRREGDELVLGACLTYAEMERDELATLVPALGQAARTIGSPQIRGAATLGGNLGTASPAGDTLPVLAALDAVVETLGPDGARAVPILELVTGVKTTSLLPGEIVTGVRVPVLRGPQEFLKVGTRNAMVISVAMVAVVVDLDGRTVRVGMGSVAPVPVRARAAEAYAGAHADWGRGRITEPAVFERFGELCAEAASPIDDHRSSAAYRRHAVAVCARRALQRALAEGARDGGRVIGT